MYSDGALLSILITGLIFLDTSYILKEIVIEYT
jgi:hypothetical protein